MSNVLQSVTLSTKLPDVAWSRFSRQPTGAGQSIACGENMGPPRCPTLRCTFQTGCAAVHPPVFTRSGRPSPVRSMKSRVVHASASRKDATCRSSARGAAKVGVGSCA
jgi:hypothetical protein